VLISSQKIDGSWSYETLSKHLMKFPQFPKEAEDLITNDAIKDKIWGTLIALAIIKSKYSQ
jgi:hypothetical protein